MYVKLDDIRLRDDHSPASQTGERQAEAATGGSALAAARTSAVRQPPVFVMNPYYTGLGVARCLHGHGLEIVGLTSERNAPGVKSRFFDSILDVPNSRDEPEALCRRLVELGRGLHQRPVLVPTRDFDVLFIHDYYAALSPYYILTQQYSSSIMVMMDKFELAQVADRIGIACPRAVVCQSVEELQEKAALLRFPVILKPRFAYQWRKQGIWDRVGGQKAIVADSLEHLLTQYRKISEALSEALVQEFVPGDDCDIVVCCGYMDERGNMLGHFTARKVLQNPSLVGTGCIVEAAEIGAIVEPTKRLLRELGHCGMAEVEFKYDRSSGVYYLIEINPRHWDQHELGRLVGVNLSLIAYRHLTGHSLLPQQPLYRVGAHYRWIAERELAVNLLHRIRRELRKPGRSLFGRLQRSGEAVRDCLRLLRGRTVFSVWSLRDPIPGLLWAGRFLREMLRYALSPKTVRE